MKKKDMVQEEKKKTFQDKKTKVFIETIQCYEYLSLISSLILRFYTQDL